MLKCVLWCGFYVPRAFLQHKFWKMAAVPVHHSDDGWISWPFVNLPLRTINFYFRIDMLAELFKCIIWTVKEHLCKRHRTTHTELTGGGAKWFCVIWSAHACSHRQDCSLAFVCWCFLSLCQRVASMWRTVDCEDGRLTWFMFTCGNGRVEPVLKWRWRSCGIVEVCVSGCSNERQLQNNH
jgi:hypothetical protein